MTESSEPSVESCLTPVQAAKLDRIAIERLGISGLVLMENAAMRCTEVLVQRFPNANVLVLCGTGNNGGDGLVIARQWAVRGGFASAWIAGSPQQMSPDCLANWTILNRLSLPNLNILPAHSTLEDCSEIQMNRPTVIIDGLLGISAKGAPRSPMAEAIVWANQSLAKRISIDVPTGLDPETGKACEPVFRADLTLTIEQAKTFALNPDARKYYGELLVVPLGIPDWIVSEAKLKASVPNPD